MSQPLSAHGAPLTHYGQEALEPLDVLGLKIYGGVACVDIRNQHFEHERYAATLRESLEALGADERIDRFVIDLRHLPRINKDVGEAILACSRGMNDQRPVLIVNKGGPMERWLHEHAHERLCEIRPFEIGHSTKEVLAALGHSSAEHDLDRTERITHDMLLAVKNDRFETAATSRRISKQDQRDLRNPEFTELNISQHVVNGITVATLESNRLPEDSPANIKFMNVMEEITRNTERGLILNLGETEYLGSTSYGVLVRTVAALKARNIPFVVVAPQKEIELNLRFKRLDSLIPIYASVEAGLGHFTG